MQLTEEQLATWRRDGSLIVPDVFRAESCLPALEAVERNAYGGLTYTEYRAKWSENPESVREMYQKLRICNDWLDRWERQFIFLPDCPWSID